MEDRTIVLTKFRCKNYYSLFIEKLVSEPSAVRAWKKIFPEIPDWGDCLSNICKSTKDNLLIFFYYVDYEFVVPLDTGNAARTLGTRLRYGQYLTHAQNHNRDEPQ